jgi:hypothetical protein
LFFGTLAQTWNCGLLLRREPVGYRDLPIHADGVHVLASANELWYSRLPGQDEQHIGIFGNVA